MLNDLLNTVPTDLLASALLLVFMLALSGGVWWMRRAGRRPAPPSLDVPVTAEAVPPAVAEAALAFHEPAPRAPDMAGLVVSEHSIITRSGDVLGNLRKTLYQSLEATPRRADLRLKLLQLLYHEGCAEEFELQKRLYAQHTDTRQDRAWAGIEKMSAELERAPKPVVAPALPPTAPARAVTPVVTSVPPAPAQRYYEHLEAAGLPQACEKLDQDFRRIVDSEDFSIAYTQLLRQQLKRPAPLQRADRLLRQFGLPGTLLLKRENVFSERHGAEINAFGQVLVARMRGAGIVYTGTRSGWHGLMVARAAAALELRCRVYIHPGQVSALTAACQRMKSLGAEVVVAQSESANPAADCRRAALMNWLEHPARSAYVCSLSDGPSPYRRIMMDLHCVSGHELQAQLAGQPADPLTGIYAPASGGMTAAGFLLPFLHDLGVRKYLAEIPGHAPFPGPMREDALLRDFGSVQYGSVSAFEAQTAQSRLAQYEGVLVSAADSHALALAWRHIEHREYAPGSSVVVLLSNPSAPEAARRG